MKVSAVEVADLVLVGVTTEMIVLRQESDPSGRHQALAHTLEVPADLCCTGLLAEPRVPTGLDQLVSAQRHRIHAVVRGGRVKLNERIRVPPVSAGVTASIHHHDVDIGFCEERINEGQAAGACAHDQVVGFDEHGPPEWTSVQATRGELRACRFEDRSTVQGR